MWLEVEARLGKFVPASYPRGNPSVEHCALDATRVLVREACDRLLGAIAADMNKEVA